MPARSLGHRWVRLDLLVVHGDTLRSGARPWVSVRDIENDLPGVVSRSTLFLRFIGEAAKEGLWEAFAFLPSDLSG